MGANITYAEKGETRIACDVMFNQRHVWLQEVDPDGAVVFDPQTGYKRASFTNMGPGGVDVHSLRNGYIEPGHSILLNVGTLRVNITATNSDKIYLNGSECKLPRDTAEEEAINRKRYPGK